MDCHELVELVTDYFEGKLSLVERQRFEEHLTGCSGCRNYLEQMRFTIRLSGQLTEAHLSPESKETLLQGFRNWKKNSKE